MRLLTLGRWERVHLDVAKCLNPGDRVLDLGCGTGALAALLARKGVQVTAVDISPPMLSAAARRLREEGLADRVVLQELGAALADASFDAVGSTLVFSELTEAEIEYALAECRRILQPGGQLLVAAIVAEPPIKGLAAWADQPR